MRPQKQSTNPTDQSKSSSSVLLQLGDAINLLLKSYSSSDEGSNQS